MMRVWPRVTRQLSALRRSPGGVSSHIPALPPDATYVALAGHLLSTRRREGQRAAAELFGDACAARACTPDLLSLFVSRTLDSRVQRAAVDAAVDAGVMPSPEVHQDLVRQLITEAAPAADVDAVSAAASALGSPVDPAASGLSLNELSSRRAETVKRWNRLGDAGLAASWQLVGRLLTKGEADPTTCAELMKGGCFGSAQQRELIDAMEAAGVPPNTLVYAELMTSLQIEADSDGARQIFGEMAAAGVDPDRWTDAALSLAGDAPALRSLRERAVRRWVQSGEDGFAAVRRLLDLLCDRQRAHEGLFVAVLRAAAFSTGEHEEWIRQMIRAGIEPTGLTYGLLVERHRMEGDEEGARGVLESATRAGVGLSGELLRAATKPESELFRMRTMLLTMLFRRGECGRDEAVAAFQKMDANDRIDETLASVVISELARAGDVAGADWAFKCAYARGRFSTFVPPRPGDTELDMHGASRAVAIAALRAHLSWLRAQLRRDGDGPRVGPWSVDGLTVIVGRRKRTTPAANIKHSSGGAGLRRMDYSGTSAGGRMEDRALGPAVIRMFQELEPPLRCVHAQGNHGRVVVEAADLRAWANASSDDWKRAGSKRKTELSSTRFESIF